MKMTIIHVAISTLAWLADDFSFTNFDISGRLSLEFFICFCPFSLLLRRNVINHGANRSVCIPGHLYSE